MSEPHLPSAPSPAGGDPPRPGSTAPSPAGGDLVLVRVESLIGLPGRPARHAFAGVVEGVGGGVRGFEPGDPVFGIAEGAPLGYLCAPEAWIARKPATLTFAAAAAVAVLIDLHL